MNNAALATSTTPSISRNSAFLAVVVIILLSLIAVVIRFYALELRPLHHDEGVNHLFIQGIERDGYYQYSHENYHGPTFFYLTWATWKIFGDTEMGMRGGVAAIGVLTFLLVPLWWMRNNNSSRWGGILAGIFIGLSPAHVYYSRYSIHETLFIGLSIFVAIVSYEWLKSPKISHGIWGGVALGLLAATKETYIITLASIGVGMLCARPKKLFSTMYRERVSALSLGFFVYVVVLFFVVSAAFTWNQGIAEVAMSIPQWIGRNSSDNGHFKPPQYYLEIIWTTEWQLLVLGLVTLMLLPWYWFKDTFSRGRFLWGWGLASLTIYSALNYKMPWIFLNISAPLILASVETFQQLKKNIAFFLVLTIALVAGGYKVYQSNFVIPCGDPVNPFAYVHTLQGEKIFINDLKEYMETHRANSPIRILVGVDGYWPLPFYFKQLENQGFNFTLGYEGFAQSINAGRQPFKEYDVIMAEQSYDGSAGPFNLDKVKGYEDIPHTDTKQWVEVYYRLADHEDTKVFFRR
jgi:uncharacterized protein (TIGR03663 family)